MFRLVKSGLTDSIKKAKTQRLYPTMKIITAVIGKRISTQFSRQSPVYQLPIRITPGMQNNTHENYQSWSRMPNKVKLNNQENKKNNKKSRQNTNSKKIFTTAALISFVSYYIHDDEDDEYHQALKKIKNGDQNELHSFHIELVIMNTPRMYRKHVIDLIGKKSLVEQLDLSDFWQEDHSYYKVRSENNNNRNRSLMVRKPVNWEEFKELCDLLGHDTVVKCLNKPQILFSRLPPEKHEEFINYIGISQLVKILINIMDHKNMQYNNGYEMSHLFLHLSEKNQKNLLSHFNVNDLKRFHNHLFDVTGTLKTLHPCNRPFFIGILGSNYMNSLIHAPHQDQRHIDDYKKMIEHSLENSTSDRSSPTKGLY